MEHLTEILMRQSHHHSQGYIGKFLQITNVVPNIIILFAPVNSVVLLLVGVLGHRVHIVRTVKPKAYYTVGGDM